MLDKTEHKILRGDIMARKQGLNIAKICIGIYFLISVFYAYFGYYNYLYELTSLSNLLYGVILIISGILGLYKKQLNMIANLMALVCIMCVYSTVFMVAFNIAQFNFDGGFMLLHGVNPLIALAFFLFTEKCEFKDKKQLLMRVFLSPILFMAYLLFDLIFYFSNGEFIYGLLPSDLAYISPIVAIVMYGLLVAMAYILIKLKKFVQTKFTENNK